MPSQITINDPEYFRVLDYVLLSKIVFDYFPYDIYIVKFGPDGLESPHSEPIGLFHHAGTRHYYWKDEIFTEYALDVRASNKICEGIKLYPENFVKILDLLRDCCRSLAPNSHSSKDDSTEYTRAIYHRE